MFSGNIFVEGKKRTLMNWDQLTNFFKIFRYSLQSFILSVGRGVILRMHLHYSYLCDCPTLHSPLNCTVLMKGQCLIAADEDPELALNALQISQKEQKWLFPTEDLISLCYEKSWFCNHKLIRLALRLLVQLPPTSNNEAICFYRGIGEVQTSALDHLPSS